MKLRHRVVLFSLALTLLFAGVAAAQTAGVPQTSTAPPPGRFRGELVDPETGDVIMKVAIQSPKELPKERRMALLFLCHGFRGHENNYIGLTVESLQKLKLDGDFIVVSGKSKNEGWTTEDDKRVLRVIEWAKKNYPIDPRRVFLFGSSNGAAFVGRFGSENQDKFAGLVGYCGGYRFNEKQFDAKDPASTKTEWYFVHGGNDNPRNSRRACDFLKERGYRYVFRQMDGYGHTDIWNGNGHPDRSVADAVREDWLKWAAALRHKEIPLTAEQEKITRDGGTADEIAWIGGPQGGEIAASLARNKGREELLLTARICSQVDCGPAARVALAEALPPADQQVVPALLEALGIAANWRDARAQAALIAFARDRSRAAAHRVLAVQEIGRAIRLALLGNFEDGHMIWATVRLLDDDDPAVRAAALAALAPAASDAFGYKPDAAAEERRAAIEKWVAWCREKCGEEPAQ